MKCIARIMRPHPLALGVDVADEIRVVALDLEIVHDDPTVGLPVAIGDDREHRPAGAHELLADLDRVGRRPADVDDEEGMPVSGDDLLGLPQGIHDLDLLEVVGGAPVESDHLFELRRGRRIVLVTGPDEVADLDLFDRLGGVRRASVSGTRACHGDKRPGNKAVRGGTAELLNADGQDRQKRQGVAEAVSLTEASRSFRCQ